MYEDSSEKNEKRIVELLEKQVEVLTRQLDEREVKDRPASSYDFLYGLIQMLELQQRFRDMYEWRCEPGNVYERFKNSFQTYVDKKLGWAAASFMVWAHNTPEPTDEKVREFLAAEMKGPGLDP